MADDSKPKTTVDLANFPKGKVSEHLEKTLDATKKLKDNVGSQKKTHEET